MIKIIYIFLFTTFCLNASSLSYQTMLFNGNCVTCHHPTKSISAPSMSLIQKTYKNAFPKKSDFVSYMANWVIHPNSNTSLMYQSIQKYELMPELGYDLDTLTHISKYIYEADFSKSHK